MARKKTVTEEPLEAAVPEETAEAPEPAVLTEEAIPTEEAEDFSEPSAAGAAEPAIDVPEPDMEQAPDFWSDALEVSPADVPPDAAVEAIGAEDDAICADALVRTTEIVAPDPALAARYEERYDQFKKIYPACKKLFKELK